MYGLKYFRRKYFRSIKIFPWNGINNQKKYKMKTNQEILDEFGKILIANVCDFPLEIAKENINEIIKEYSESIFLIF